MVYQNIFQQIPAREQYLETPLEAGQQIDPIKI